MTGKRLHASAGWQSAGPAHEASDLGSAVVKRSFGVNERCAVVGHEHDQRIFRKSCLAQHIQNLADAAVHEIDRTIKVG